MSTTNKSENRKTRALLWTIQGLLAALFLFAGGMKLVTASDALAAQSSLPVAFLRFIGIAEIAGALGLVLPGILGIRRELTALAAAGLTSIMVGATVLTAVTVSPGAALVPCIVGLLAAFVAYKRRPSREIAILARQAA